MNVPADQAVFDAILRTDFPSFLQKAFETIAPGDTYRHNWHIDGICHELDRVRRGESRRLIITQPPRSLKSICSSVAWVAWMIGQNPSLRFACVSYSNELAALLARQFRAVVTSDWYRRTFPNVRALKVTQTEFATTKGGGRVAISVGGTFTGRGADIIIVDDPMKADEALSDLKRKAVLEWYATVLISRLNDKVTGSIIVVMQRLHVDDLVGYLLHGAGAAAWAHLDLPAIAEEDQVVEIGDGRVHHRKAGEVLQPDREPLYVLEQIKGEMGSAAFSAQYQQRPAPPEGNMIKRAWLQYYSQAPAHDSDGRIIQSWDTASKGGVQNDYSVCTTWLMKADAYYLIHVYRARLDYPALRQRVIELAHRFAAHFVLIEDAVSGTPLVQEFKYERKLGVRVSGIRPDRDKESRMGVASVDFEAGRVFLPREANWLEAFEAEMLVFPNGKYDDQADSVSQFLGWAAKHRLKRSGVGSNVGLY